MKTKNGFTRFSLPCFFITIFIFLMPLLSFAAQPGINIDHYGASTWTSNSSSPFTSMDFWIKIVDYDGIANDGSSHTVTVTYPDGTTVKTLNFQYKENDYTAPYSFYDNTIPQPIDPLTYSGYYVFRVEDSNHDWSEVIDHVDVNAINPPDETTFLPNFDTTVTLTAYFDDVYVNGVLFDDFNSGVFDPTKWEWQPNEVTYENNEVRIEKTYYTSSGSVWFSLKDEGFLDELKATVRGNTISGTSSKARIMGNFWQENGVDVYCQIRIQENNATYSIFKDVMVDGHIIGEIIVDITTLGPITQGNNYELSMQWDGSTITFHAFGLDDSVDYTDTYSPSGTVSLPSDPEAKIGVARHLELDTTTPDLSWDVVPGSEFYRVGFYAYDENWNTIYRDYTGATSFTMPPGILKPNGYYKYRVDSYRDHQWMETDNKAGSDRDKQFIIAGPDEAQDPYVDLHSIGVETWTNDLPVGTFTSFYIKVHDAQGVPGNIESVKVLLPDGVTEASLYLDYNDSSTCGTYRGHYFGTIQAGEYTFTVIDKDGNSHSKAETLVSNPIDPSSEASLLPANNTVVGDTEVSFDWDDVSGAAFYEVTLYDKDLNYLFRVRTTESEYTLPPGLLEENSQYRYRVSSRREFFEDNSDNGASAPDSTWNANTFFTTATFGTETPTLNLDSFGVAVWQGPHPETGVPVYELDFLAMVTDSDGVPENIERVEVTYPDGITTRLLKYSDSPNWGSNYFAEEYYADLSSIQDTTNTSGIYTIRVVDFDGNEVTLTDTLTDVTSHVLPWPANLSPANDTDLYNTTPIITWDSVIGASYYKVRILRSWGSSTVHWSSELTQTQYTVPGGALEPNTIYSYRVYAYREAIGTEVDFFSSSNYWHSTNNHFTTGAAAGDELATDFGTNGLWHYDGASWSILTSWNPDDDLAGWSGGMAVDFGVNGLWNHDGSLWSQLTGWNPGSGGLAGWNGGLAVDFDANGLWFYDGSLWSMLTGWNPGSGGLISWNGGLAVDFDANGLWNYDGSSWSFLTSWNPEGMAGWNGSLAVDFGDDGLWIYDGSSWSFLTSWNPEGMAGWNGSLAVDFGNDGLWSNDASSWRQLTSWNPTGMSGWGGGLAVDFGVNGLWNNDGSSWSMLTSWHCENMADVDLN